MRRDKPKGVHFKNKGNKNRRLHATCSFLSDRYLHDHTGIKIKGRDTGNTINYLEAAR